MKKALIALIYKDMRTGAQLCMVFQSCKNKKGAEAPFLFYELTMQSINLELNSLRIYCSKLQRRQHQS